MVAIPFGGGYVRARRTTAGNIESGLFNEKELFIYRTDRLGVLGAGRVIS